MGRGLGIRVALALSVCFSTKVFGLAKFDGFVKIASGISLYAKTRPGATDAPVIVLLNGLTQDSDHWFSTVPFLESKNANIVLIDLALQGRSMVRRLEENFNIFRPIIPPLVLHGGLWDLEPTFPETEAVR